MADRDAKKGGWYLVLLLAGSALTIYWTDRDRGQPVYHDGTKTWTFGDYDCKEAGCQGHVAGYQWAESHSVEAESDCANSSRSFSEGCLTYLDGYLESLRDREESSPADFVN